MAIAIKNTLRNYRLRIVNGPVGQFLRWWWEELREAMPAQFRARLQYARRKLLIQVEDEEVTLSIIDGDAVQSLAVLSTNQDIQLLQQQVREILQQHELTEVNRDLLLAEGAVLRTSVVMPLATEANLRQALAYEMDRHTPFQAEQVFYNWLIVDRDREAGQLHFELFVTPRAPVEEQVELLQKIGLAPLGVDIATSNGRLGINLLPETMRYHIVRQQVRMNWALGAVTALLLVFVMVQSLWLREQQIESINEAIEDVRAEAMVVQQIRKQIEDAGEAASFLQDHIISNGYKVEMLAEITRILPQDTYLDRVSLNAETAQMQGKSDSAQSLIELINASPYFDNASFRGPTRLDTRSGKEIFDLSASAIQKGAE